MKTVLLLMSTIRFSVPLIRYMVIEGRRYGWKICVGSMFEPKMADQLRHEKFSKDVVFINITDYRQCVLAIRKVDLVIGMLPDAMLLQVADLCIANKKSFITPARLNRQMLSRKPQIEENETLFLMECGFAAGLDHITAKKAIDNIHIRGGRISSFKSYSGNILAEDSIDNPLEFKLIDTAADTIQIGRQTNRQLIKGKISHIPYQHLFERAESIKISGLKDLSVIPEGDALYCKKIYQLNEADTVVKGRILRSEFEQIWRLLINLGMTDPHPKIEMFEFASYYNFLDSLLPYSEDEHLETRLKKFINATEEDILKLRWLGLFDDEWINAKDPTPATLLQHLLEKKFAMDDKDKDCIIMQHQMEYILKGVKHRMKATLVAQGENKTDSATAKAIGLTTGAAAKAFLLDNIKVKGLFIPTTKDIYEPILAELVDLGVGFHVEETIVQGYSIDEERIINV